MANETTNHAYNTPAEGSTNWHLPLNSNFSNLEVDIEVRDTDGNKGSYTAHNGAKFTATDTGDIYLGDGSDWNKIGSIGPEDLSNYARTDQDETFTKRLTVSGVFTFESDVEDAGGNLVYNSLSNEVPGARLGSHSHSPSALTGGGATGNEVLVWDGTNSEWIPQAKAPNADQLDGYTAADFSKVGHTHAHGDLTSIGTSDHHVRPSAGTNLSEDTNDNFNVVDAADGGTIDAATLAGAGPSGYVQTSTQRDITSSTSSPSGGDDGDIHIQHS